MKTLKQQVGDALWYLKKPGQDPGDEAKAIEILSHVAFGKRAPTTMSSIRVAEPPQASRFDLSAVAGKQVAMIVGHQPGGGAMGERSYNKKIAYEMKRILHAAGADAFVYEHRLRSYSARQREMRSAVKKAQPDNFVCIELHFDAVSYPTASGHHFQYRGAKGLAGAIRDEFQRRYPQCQALRDNGIMRNTKSNGAGFLKQAPGWAVLTEPFFRTNPSEWSFFKDRHQELAEIYCIGIAKFSKKQRV